VAREAGVDRSWLYSQTDLAQEIAELRQQTSAPLKPRPRHERASADSLRTRLAAAGETIDRLRAELTQQRADIKRCATRSHDYAAPTGNPVPSRRADQRNLEPAPRTMIALLISLVAAYLPPATPVATTCGHWLDAATARDRVAWVEINCEDLPCPCSTKAGGGSGGGHGGGHHGEQASCTKPKGVQRVVFSKSKYPNIRKHFRIALRKGWPRRLVVNRPGADARRDRVLEDIPTKEDFDRDEYPPAVGRGKGPGLERGRNPRGWKAHVRYVGAITVFSPLLITGIPQAGSA